MTLRAGLSTALALGAGAVLLALPLWPDEAGTANRKLEERIDGLEDALARVDDRSRNGEAKALANEAVLEDLGRQLARVRPEDSAWIDLTAGGGNKWTLPNGREATVKYVGLGDNGTLRLRIKHPTIDGDFALRVGESLRVIDDVGTEQRIYTTAVHGLERDRTGTPKRARVSVTLAVEPAI